MGAVTASNVQSISEGGLEMMHFYIASATAADTIDVSGYLQGRTPVEVRSFEVTGGTPITDSSISSGTVTIGTGPSTEPVLVVVTLWNLS